MKKIAVPALFFLVLIAVGSAPCPVIYTPPNSFVHLTDESQGLVAYDNATNTERYVFRQAYEGVASDFGLVLPTPGEPNFTERSGKLFKQLHDLTKKPVNKNRGPDVGMAAQRSLDQEVRVVKQRDVGDFTATVLEADSADALIDWLNENGYDYQNQSTANFEYYIDKGGFYFTALKVNVEAADCLSRREFEIGKNPRFQQRIPDDGTTDGQCWLRGGLQPIEFQFTSDRPMLPLRIMSRPHDSSPMTSGSGDGHDHETLPPGNFLIYTLADQPLVSPGAKVQFADRIGSVDKPLGNYNPQGKFLVRQRIKFNAHKVEDDLYFKEAEPFHVGRAEAVTLNPDDTDTANGMMAFDATPKNIALTSNPSLAQELEFRISSFMAGIGSFIGDLIDLLVFVPVLQQVASEAPHLFLLLIHPIVYGVLWVRRKALKYVFGGTYLGVVGATILLSIYQLLTVTYGDPGVFTYIGYGVVVSLLPATVAAVIAFLASLTGQRVSTLQQVQQKMANAGWKASLTGVAMPPVLASGYALLMSDVMDTSPLLLSTLFFTAVSGAGAFLLYRRHRHDDSQKIDTARWDWTWFAAALIGALIGLLVLGVIIGGTTRVVA